MVAACGAGGVGVAACTGIIGFPDVPVPEEAGGADGDATIEAAAEAGGDAAADASRDRSAADGEGGASVCDGASCPHGCCNGATCETPSPTYCGTSGGACAACSGTTPDCILGSCSAAPPPSCAPGGAGMTTCPAGTGTSSCCASQEVAGGTYSRMYTNSGSGPTGTADSATVSNFRLDEYEVTVGRFRQFVAAWNNGAGYTPPAGSGKHTHLNGGQGLANSGSAGTYETGWVASDDSNIAPTTSNLSCDASYQTWTASAGSNENLPINCVNWWESYAFCIWDGGFLPSEAEWEYAAAGGSQEREYPWGTAALGTACPGTGCEYAIYNCDYPIGSGSCTGVTNIAPVGTATLGGGVYGQLDLAGNVSEWNLDWYATYVNPCTDCAYLTATSPRVFRGGYFLYLASLLLPPSRYGGTPPDRDGDVGFRCARTP